MRGTEEIFRKHCACRDCDNKIVLEAISVCPGCFTFFSKVLADIPGDRVPEALSKIGSVLREMGLLKESDEVTCFRDSPPSD